MLPLTLTPLPPLPPVRVTCSWSASAPPGGRDRDAVPLPKLPLEQALGQRGFQLPLHCALDRPRSKDRVEALGLQADIHP